MTKQVQSATGNGNHSITREQFMAFFRSDAYHQQLTPDDCVEVFLSTLVGGSDVTSENLEALFGNYDVDYTVHANAPELYAACHAVVQQRDCKCGEAALGEADYVCSVCRCANALAAVTDTEVLERHLS